MSTINSSTLFHFTRNNKNLLNILSKGLRFSYAFESVPVDVLMNEYETFTASVPDVEYDESKKYGIAIPMISFCDIPLMRTIQHRRKYGNFAIGLDKDFLSQLYNDILNPVQYYDSINMSNMLSHIATLKRESHENCFNETLNSLSNLSENETLKKMATESIEAATNAFFNNEKLKSVRTKNANTAFYINNILGFSKPYGYKNIKEKYICNYDEREWRAIIHDKFYDDMKWEWFIDKAFFDNKDNKKELNKKIEKCDDGYLTIPHGWLDYAITHIIVKNDDDIRSMVNFIMKSKKIFGVKNVSEEERWILISKITSFERLEKDF